MNRANPLLVEAQEPLRSLVGSDREVFPASYRSSIREDIDPLIEPLGGTVLDLGGGDGLTALRLKRLGKFLRAGVIDLFEPPTAEVGLDFSAYGDIEDVRFLDETLEKHGPFRTILALDVLEHLKDPWGVVARLHRALEPSGTIIASIPNVRHWSVLLPLLFRNRWDLKSMGILDRTHLRFFVRGSAIELMTSSGLQLDRIIATTSDRLLVNLFRSATLGLLNTFTDVQYIILVRRNS